MPLLFSLFDNFEKLVSKIQILHMFGEQQRREKFLTSKIWSHHSFTFVIFHMEDTVECRFCKLKKKFTFLSISIQNTLYNTYLVSQILVHYNHRSSVIPKSETHPFYILHCFISSVRSNILSKYVKINEVLRIVVEVGNTKQVVQYVLQTLFLYEFQSIQRFGGSASAWPLIKIFQFKKFF